MLFVALALGASAWAPDARADVAPSPQRPDDWDREAPPMPEPPPEKELERALLLMGLGLGALAAASLASRGLGRRVARARGGAGC